MRIGFMVDDVVDSTGSQDCWRHDKGRAGLILAPGWDAGGTIKV